LPTSWTLSILKAIAFCFFAELRGRSHYHYMWIAQLTNWVEAVVERRDFTHFFDKRVMRGTQKTELTEVKQRQLLYIRSSIDRWRLTLPWF
jgi:hypothetical protein